MKYLPCVILGLCLVTFDVTAQETESLQRKNAIKLDLTSYWLFRNALNFSYERITNPNQTFSVTAGYQEFPRTSNLGSNIAVKEDNKKNGLKFGAEYRFYLAKENKFSAPHGIYIGPYIAFNRFNNDRLIEIEDSGALQEASLTSNLSILNVGFQLGYQFVIKDRWVVDLIFVGPSISNYHFKLKLDGASSLDSEDIQNDIILALIDRLPLLKEVIDEKEAVAKGTLDVWSYGYRYQLHVGYRFGRKK